MDRRYQRVGLGVGAFHNPPRAKYSEDTRNLIKLLMEESKLTMLQRKTIQEAVDKGESLPSSIDRRKTKDTDNKTSKHYCVKIPSACRRRSQDTIISSGAYEREQYRKTAPLPNTDQQKRHLACMMAFGKDMPETPHGPKILHRAKRESRMIPENADVLNELIESIKERMEFLNDMESLGMGNKYRPIIQQEIAQKIRLIESMEKQMPEEIRKEIRKEISELKYEKPSPKPFPQEDLDEN